MRSLVILLAATTCAAPPSVLAQQMLSPPEVEHHQHQSSSPVGASDRQANHAAHAHAVGPKGATYNLRWMDAVVQHHKGALRMSEFVFDIGAPGVGSLAKAIWNDQSQEIKAMGQWRKAWFPEAPAYPVTNLPDGDPNSLSGVTRMTKEQISATRMLNSMPTKTTE